MNRVDINKFYSGPSIDVSYQVSVHLPTRFRRRIFLIDQSETRLPVVAMFVNGSERIEQPL
jgi:hypothetical protein